MDPILISILFSIAIVGGFKYYTFLQATKLVRKYGAPVGLINDPMYKQLDSALGAEIEKYNNGLPSDSNYAKAALIAFIISHTN